MECCKHPPTVNECALSKIVVGRVVTFKSHTPPELFLEPHPAGYIFPLFYWVWSTFPAQDAYMAWRRGHVSKASPAMVWTLRFGHRRAPPENRSPEGHQPPATLSSRGAGPECRAPHQGWQQAVHIVRKAPHTAPQAPHWRAPASADQAGCCPPARCAYGLPRRSPIH